MMRKGSNGYLPALRFSVLTPFYDLLVALTTRERTFRHELSRFSMTSQVGACYIQPEEKPYGPDA